MYLLQVWFSLSDEGVEVAVYDSYAMRRFMGLDFAVEQVPDATTLLHFRHLLEAHQLGERLLAAQNEIFEQEGGLRWAGDGSATCRHPPGVAGSTVTRRRKACSSKSDSPWSSRSSWSGSVSA